MAALAGAGLLGAMLVNPAPTAMFQANPALAQDRYANAPLSFADLAEKTRPAVVSIFTKNGSGRRGFDGGPDFNFPDLPRDHPFRDFFDQFRRGLPDGGRQRRPQPPIVQAQGSGFLVSEDGYVVTNHHVVDKAEEISVAFENDERYDAKVVGSDPRTDIAVLKIESDKKFPVYLHFAKTLPRVGDWVLAVGNPFGLGGTVTAGIVSAGGRNIGSGPYDFLQIDAAVNRGNSGGPAINLDGEVVGVNTAIFSPSGGNVGIAFAIPADLAASVVEQLRTKGVVSRGWLGVTIQDVSEDIAESLGAKEARGALITNILEDGPAAKSELRPRDVIIDVNGSEIKDSRDLARKIADLEPDSDAELTVIRDGEERTITLKLGTFPSSDEFAALDPSRPSGGGELEGLGLTLAPAKDVQGAGDEGVAVTDVDPSSEAAEKGVQAGDVILEIGGKSVSSPDDVIDGVREAKERGRKAVLLQIRSNRQQRFVALSLENSKE